MKTVKFHTLGCKVNQYETEAMEELFLKAGYQAAQDDDQADVHVINTCTVTHFSDGKSRQLIRRMKRKNPRAVIAVVGCYAQVAPQEVAAIEGVDLVLGTKGRAKLPDLVAQLEASIQAPAEGQAEGQDQAESQAESQVESQTQAQIHVADLEKDRAFDPLFIQTELSRTRAAIKIQEGCDMYCSYCIIPYARGHIASRSLASILQEVQGLADRGFQEIVLTGIHVASYGKDRPLAAKDGGLASSSRQAATSSALDAPARDLIDLVEAIAKETDIGRIRLSSLEPRWVSLEKLERLRATGKFCPHFHLSLQSGSDRVLQAMNRKYDRALYAEKIALIRQVFPQAGLTTDVIVGFPQESEEDFQETVDFCRKMAFSKIHIFPYSPRKGTPAALFQGQIDAPTKKDRAQRLAQVEQALRQRFLQDQLGSIQRVLFEEEGGEADRMEGYSENYCRVSVPRQDKFRNRISSVRLLEVEGDRILGRIEEE